eukprot:TRINITY_DN93405_c0_g1_i1.p1 TRINITY_DN93405_c0_g1~~TRINITY_DN93405_c0_g1_i1.p1  ORF type:complete len:155 (+),score=32.87 TRINITY_DN93405_c0_g1_i1:60-524(+)
MARMLYSALLCFLLGGQYGARGALVNSPISAIGEDPAAKPAWSWENAVDFLKNLGRHGEPRAATEAADVGSAAASAPAVAEAISASPIEQVSPDMAAAAAPQMQLRGMGSNPSGLQEVFSQEGSSESSSGVINVKLNSELQEAAKRISSVSRSA